jgi:hypothetical protein
MCAVMRYRPRKHRRKMSTPTRWFFTFQSVLAAATVLNQVNQNISALHGSAEIRSALMRVRSVRLRIVKCGFTMPLSTQAIPYR